MAEGSGKLIIGTILFVVAVFLLSLFYPLGFLKIIRWFLLVLLFLLCWFFRDPARKIPEGPDNILSPADGKIISIETLKDKQKIAIFMSLFDVHVNRVPITGKVVAKEYVPGQYLPAFSPNCHLKNEQSKTIIKNERVEVKLTQIAGLVARKIVNNLKIDMELQAGQRFGLIKLGSRVDLEIPHKCRINCREGQKVKAGETIIAKIV